MHVGYKTKSVYLDGNVTLLKGEIKIEFCNPLNEVVYEHRIYTPGVTRMDEIIPVGPGIWKLKYQSINGEGSIDLHASF
jgi:hypothetical protein